jgi:hypothetical protein
VGDFHSPSPHHLFVIDLNQINFRIGKAIFYSNSQGA